MAWPQVRRCLTAAIPSVDGLVACGKFCRARLSVPLSGFRLNNNSASMVLLKHRQPASTGSQHPGSPFMWVAWPQVARATRRVEQSCRVLQCMIAVMCFVSSTTGWGAGSRDSGRCLASETVNTASPPPVNVSSARITLCHERYAGLLVQRQAAEQEVVIQIPKMGRSAAHNLAASAQPFILTPGRCERKVQGPSSRTAPEPLRPSHCLLNFQPLAGRSCL